MQKIEDEIHFLTESPNYLHEREKLLTSIYECCKNFSQLSNQNKFLWLMSSDDTNIIQSVSHFIHTCFEIRQQNEKWQTGTYMFDRQGTVKLK